MPHLDFSPLTLLLLQIATIVLVARALGLITHRLAQPLVIAEVLAGIVLGPSLLGAVWPEAMAAIFPPESLFTLKMLSQVGLVLFMFMIGLELDPKLLSGRTHSSIAISHTSIVVPFVLGAGAAAWLYATYSEPTVSFVSFALFLGAAMSVTAFPVLARILSERHLLTSRVGVVTIACAAVDDVTAWCILAFVVAIARAEGVLPALWTTGMALGFIGLMVFAARPALARVGARVASRDGLTPTITALTFMLLLVSSMITEVIGIHALFGAFLFGAILPKEGKLPEILSEKVETVAVLLLLPLFFAYSGLRTEIGLVSQPREWLVTCAIIGLATAGKFGGSVLAARCTGLRWREASAIGILMNTRGLMELIVLNIGMDLGVISPTLFTMLVIMALVTTFATSPILRWVYPDDELARDRLVGTSGTELVAGSPPYTVMMCVSDEREGPGLAQIAGVLAGRRERPIRFFALHLWAPTDHLSLDLRRSDSADAASPLDPLLGEAQRRMLDVKPLSFVSAEPALDICRTAEAKAASVLLLGPHKPWLTEDRLGGTVREVVARSTCAVAVLLDRGLVRLGKVLIAYVGGPEDAAALDVARRMGAAPGVHVTLVHVVPPSGRASGGQGRQSLTALLGEPHGAEDSEESARDADAVQRFDDPSLSAGHLSMKLLYHESPPDAVLAELEMGYDLVVLGMHSHWGLDSSVISLRRRRILSEARVSILAVHPPAMPGLPRAQQAPADLAREA